MTHLKTRVKSEHVSIGINAGSLSTFNHFNKLNINIIIRLCSNLLTLYFVSSSLSLESYKEEFSIDTFKKKRVTIIDSNSI